MIWECEAQMKRLETILKEKNSAFIDAQKQGIPQDERDFTRDFLLSLHTFGLSAEEIKIALVGALNDKTANPFVMPWDRLQQAIYEKYMLDIGTEEKPDIKPCFGCWLNVYSRVISTVKPVDFFAEKNTCIWIKDYRSIGGIDWKDIAEC